MKRWKQLNIKIGENGESCSSSMAIFIIVPIRCCKSKIREILMQTSIICLKLILQEKENSFYQYKMDYQKCITYSQLIIKTNTDRSELNILLQQIIQSNTCISGNSEIASNPHKGRNITIKCWLMFSYELGLHTKRRSEPYNVIFL